MTTNHREEEEEEEEIGASKIEEEQDQRRRSSSPLKWISEPIRRFYETLRSPNSIDPNRDTSKFIGYYENKYGTNRTPTFIQESFHSSVTKCNREAKFLLVYLHSREHQNTDGFCVGTLGSTKILDLFNEHDVLVWGGDIFHAEARSISYMLRATTFPFLALLSPKSSAAGKRFHVLTRIEGTRSSNDLARNLTDAITKHRQQVIDVRRENETREAQRNLRTSQDAAYRAALEADRKKREAEEEAKEKAELEAAVALSKKLEEEAEMVRKKAAIADEPPAGQEGVSTFVFRLPNGSRLTRRFEDTNTLEFVFNYLDVVFNEGEGPKHYAMTAYPHRRFCREKASDLDLTLKELKLTGRVALFVNNLDA